jgi:hypothetical protein
MAEEVLYGLFTFNILFLFEYCRELHIDTPLNHTVQAMKDRMKNLAESLGMPPGLGGGPGM